MSEYTLEQKLDYAIKQRDLAQAAIDAADGLRERAREMGGGLLSFGGSGPQNARRQVQTATERGVRASIAAEERFKRWDQKAKQYERQITERDRKRLTREDLVGATHVRLSSGWWEVARLNPTTVAVKTGYSWTDRHAFDKVIEARTVDASHSLETS